MLEWISIFFALRYSAEYGAEEIWCWNSGKNVWWWEMGNVNCRAAELANWYLCLSGRVIFLFITSKHMSGFTSELYHPLQVRRGEIFSESESSSGMERRLEERRLEERRREREFWENFAREFWERGRETESDRQRKKIESRRKGPREKERKKRGQEGRQERTMRRLWCLLG